ncbi:hypothetical protein IMZ31_23240 (plasmid) [Pontibacillus sp. ALD_SL1]|uniref:hypothetical protein n=1 Tax=Pontibacillus sp. ALD_SL1 TaxID=2777185 RepID=UPI001A95F55C|nr:hypothetical protein [Pontibacillus sp. ALD_SL1]QST02368.1 hypothetical protein IMZ31_23240 [Pontibacillus sp. ALD_SL1]
METKWINSILNHCRDLLNETTSGELEKVAVRNQVSTCDEAMFVLHLCIEGEVFCLLKIGLPEPYALALEKGMGGTKDKTYADEVTHSCLEELGAILERGLIEKMAVTENAFIITERTVTKENSPQVHAPVMEVEAEDEGSSCYFWIFHKE